MNVGDRVVLKANGKIWLPKDTMRGGARVYIPAAIVLDSQFPFEEDGEITVEIDAENQIIKLKPTN
ncbi:MAG: hypothetical protein JRI56_04705 [Deltaproteobacteria bacterium]|nr:hypothetical protein [Deltaproteobacteria bacterium]